MPIAREHLLETARFVMAVGGIAMLGYGSWLHYPPLGFVVGGLMLTALALVGIWRAR